MAIRTLLASGAVLATVAAPVYAEAPQGETPFRAVEAQAFTTDDLQRYGLSEAEAEKGMDLQEQGYEIVALTPEEAEAYQAGAITQQDWILIGVGVLVILAIA